MIYPKIIFGIGNPGLLYEKTWHNLGFMVIDKCLQDANIIKEFCKFQTLVYQTKFYEQDVWFLKPQAFVNLSGDCLQKIITYYGFKLEQILVVCDDFDLPLGKLRIRAHGSAGTHNGMRNIVKNLNSLEFARLRIGINPQEIDNKKIDLIKYVLTKINKNEQEILDIVLDKAKNICIGFCKNLLIQNLANKYN